MTLPILGGLLFILLLILLIFMKIKVELFFLLSQSENYITILIVTLFGLVRIKKKLSLEEVLSGEVSEDIEEVIPDFSWDSTKKLLKNMKPALTLMKTFIRTIRISKLEWRTKIGTGDAALTGTVAGAVWAIKGALISLIRSFLFFTNRPLITVQPNYQGFSAETNIRCMVEMKTGKAIVAGIKMYKEWKKYKKSSQFNGENQKIVRRTING